MLTNRRRFIGLYIPVLVLALVVLYLARPMVQPSTAEVMPALMTFEAAQFTNQEDLKAASQVLEERLVSQLQEDVRFNFAVEGNHLTVSLPDNVGPSIVVAEASRVGRVELVDGGTEFLPLSRMVKTGPRPVPDQDVYQAVLNSSDFEAAEAELQGDGRPVIKFVLTPTGDARLAAYTAELRGYYLCLAIDSRVVNCPVLRTPLTDRRGTIELTGDASLDDARILAVLLRTGPLPVPLTLASD